jgi:hypothetical protein
METRQVATTQPAVQTPAIPGKLDSNLDAKIADNLNAQPEQKQVETDKNTEPKSPEQNPEKPYKIKVNGREMDVSLEELKVMAQRATGAQKKFDEAARIRTQSETLIKLLRENPLKILQNPNLGIDFKKIATDYLFQEIQEQVKFYNEKFDREISAALQTANLPKTPNTIKRVAYYLSEGLKRGHELKAADVMGLVRSDYIKDFTDLFSLADGESLAKILGEESLKKIREHELKKVQSPPARVPAMANATPASSANTKKLDPIEWRKSFEEQYGS